MPRCRVPRSRPATLLAPPCPRPAPRGRAAGTVRAASPVAPQRFAFFVLLALALGVRAQEDEVEDEEEMEVDDEVEEAEEELAGYVLASMEFEGPVAEGQDLELT